MAVAVAVTLQVVGVIHKVGGCICVGENHISEGRAPF